MAKNIPVDWSIYNLDTLETLRPPYPVAEEGVRVTVGGRVIEQDRFGLQDPILQWVGGKTKTITFSTVMWATYNTEKIAATFKKFEALAEEDSTLERPPIVVFALGSGSILAETCMVESVDPEILPVMATGEPRHVILNFTLKRYVPFSQKQIDPTKPGKESYYLVASRAEASYEMIARRFYGDPLKGDRIRKRHPDMPFIPTVGTRVKLPAKSIILREEVRPAAHMNDPDDEDAVARFEEILEARNSRKVVING